MGREENYTIEPEANLRGADLRGANLRWANLRGADLRRAKTNDDTRLPCGPGWRVVPTEEVA